MYLNNKSIYIPKTAHRSHESMHQIHECIMRSSRCQSDRKGDTFYISNYINSNSKIQSRQELYGHAFSALWRPIVKLSGVGQSLDGWPKIYYQELLRVSDGTLSRWSRLHLQSLAPINPYWGPHGGLWPVLLICIIRKACAAAMGTLIDWWWWWWWWWWWLWWWHQPDTKMTSDTKTNRRKGNPQTVYDYNVPTDGHRSCFWVRTLAETWPSPTMWAHSRWVST
jgi:hypothetical protein